MHGLEDLRHTIDTVKELQSIVGTMKALSAASINQYEQALKSLLDYRRTVEMGLHVVLQGKLDKPQIEHPAPGHRLGAIVFGSDRGLCGRFNEEIAEFAIAKVNGFQIHQEDRRFLAVGARVDAALQAQHQQVEESFFVPGSVSGIRATVQQILIKVDEWRDQQQLDHVLLIYHQHSPEMARPEPRMLHLLPIDLARFRSIVQQPWPSHRLPTFNLDSQQLFASLIREYLFVTIFSACANSLVSEHNSRLLSMQGAEKNIDDRLNELNFQFSQQRQASITAELQDIVTGFEVIQGEEKNI
jgi:F-type H+-transporting ATPase subunit gamma